MLKRFDRITAIFLKLQSRTMLKAEHLATEFQVSLRTIYRDIRSLEAAGVPIVSEAGVGYQLMPGYRLPPVMFTHEEARSFLTGGKLMGHFTDQALSGSYQSALDKVKAVLQTDEKWRLENLEEKIALKPFGTETQAKGPHLPEILQALTANRVLKISYYSPGNMQTTEREVEPVGVFFSRFWYMAAWCRLRKDYRSFRLDRILKLETSDQKFKAHTYSLNEHMENFKVKESLTTVKLSLDRNVLQLIGEQKYHHGLVDQQQDGNREIMTFLSPSLEHLSYWVLSMGTFVEILEPDYLKKEVKQMVKGLHEHYFEG